MEFCRVYFEISRRNFLCCNTFIQGENLKSKLTRRIHRSLYFCNEFNLRENYSTIYGKRSFFTKFSVKSYFLFVAYFKFLCPTLSHRIKCELLLLVIPTLIIFMFSFSNLLTLFCKLCSIFCLSLASCSQCFSELHCVITPTTFHNCRR